VYDTFARHASHLISSQSSLVGYDGSNASIKPFLKVRSGEQKIKKHSKAHKRATPYTTTRSTRVYSLQGDTYEAASTDVKETPGADTPIVIESDSGGEATDAAGTLSLKDTLRRLDELRTQVQIDNPPAVTVSTSLAAISVPSLEVPVSAPQTLLPESYDLHTKMEYYKKLALFFSCGIRLFHEMTSDVPPYFWRDDYPAMCPYRAQLREIAWPPNFPNLGHSHHTHVLQEMAKQAGQMLQGPPTQDTFCSADDSKLIDDLLSGLAADDDADGIPLLFSDNEAYDPIIAPLWDDTDTD